MNGEKGDGRSRKQLRPRHWRAPEHWVYLAHAAELNKRNIGMPSVGDWLSDSPKGWQAAAKHIGRLSLNSDESRPRGTYSTAARTVGACKPYSGYRAEAAFRQGLGEACSLTTAMSASHTGGRKVSGSTAGARQGRGARRGRGNLCWKPAGRIVRFDTMPSRPILQAWANTVGPSAARCSFSRRPGPTLASTED